jgi:peptidoglycan/LPS O-acetylase OafA/YrhL
LTGIRAIAAILVFLYHNRKHWRAQLPEPVLRLFNEFHCGVSLFFVLSGFLITYTYMDRPWQSRREYMKYLLIRLVRIFPVYLLILTVMYCDDGFPSTKQTLLTYTLLHGLSDKWNLEGITQAWSLTVEIGFYITAPLLYFLYRKKPWKAIGLLVLMALLATGIGYGWHAWNGNKDSFLYPWKFIFYGTFPGRSLEFFMGMLLAHFILTGRPNGLSLRYTTLTGGLLLLAILYGMNYMAPDIYSHGFQTLPGLIIRNVAFPVATIIFFHGLITEKTWLRWFLSTRLLVLLGNASYVFYLIHISYVNMEIRQWLLFPDRNFTLLWILSIVIYLLVEKPVYTWARRKIKRTTSP